MSVSAYCESAGLVDDLDVLNAPAREWLVEGRLPEAAIALLVGASGVGKSLLALDLACSVVMGIPWLGAATRAAGPVVYIDVEGSDLKARLRAWKTARGFSPDRRLGVQFWLHDVDLSGWSSETQVMRAVVAAQPRLVILDTFARSMSGEENSARDVGAVVRVLTAIRNQTGATVLVLHHTNKAGTGERGSGALRAACDTVLTLSGDDVISLRCDKQRDGLPFAALSLRLTPEAGSVVVRLAVDVIEPPAVTERQLQVLAALQDAPQGLRAMEWQSAVPAVATQTFYRAIKVLAKTGAVRKVGLRYFCASPAVLPIPHGMNVLAGERQR